MGKYDMDETTAIRILSVFGTQFCAVSVNDTMVFAAFTGELMGVRCDAIADFYRNWVSKLYRCNLD